MSRYLVRLWPAKVLCSLPQKMHTSELKTHVMRIELKTHLMRMWRDGSDHEKGREGERGGEPPGRLRPELVDDCRGARS